MNPIVKQLCRQHKMPRAEAESLYNQARASLAESPYPNLDKEEIFEDWFDLEYKDFLKSHGAHGDTFWEEDVDELF